MILRSLRFVTVLAMALTAGLAGAQESDVPYWASLDVDKVYMRVGPGSKYRIEWVYEREGLPVKVLRVNEGWRHVEDPDGTKGWIAGRLLTRTRAAIVTGEDKTEMRAEPSPDAQLRWYLEPGVIGLLGDCEADWCELDVGGHKGWVSEARLWGAGAP